MSGVKVLKVPLNKYHLELTHEDTKNLYMEYMITWL